MLSLALTLALLPTPPEATEIAVGELVFDALQAGPEDGELVLLLHGFPQTSHSFRAQVAALGAAGYRAVAPDQRGYSPGARPLEVEDYAMPRLVEDVVGMADALGAEEFHVVGHDWGAAVAWFTAIHHPERVLTVAALSIPHPRAFSAAASDPAGDQASRSSYMAEFRKPDAAQRFLANDAALLRGIYSSTGIDEHDVAVYLDALGSEPALDAALNWYRAMGASVPNTRSWTPIAMPALYVWSTNDPVVSPAAAKSTGDFIHGPYRFETLEGVSHWIPEEAAERVSAFLLEHLAGEASPAARAGAK